MSRLCIETRGIASWRERLASPDTQWKRGYSAFETAVSWEGAAGSETGLPEQIGSLLHNSIFDAPKLILAIAEHKVPLPGGRAESQCDVWALLETAAGGLSLSVEAKANEAFGQGNESLERWLIAGKSELSRQNRSKRWKHIEQHLPQATDTYSRVAYQLLHRCAAAVIEAKRLRLPNAAFVVQAFGSPPESFEAFSTMCAVMEVAADRKQLQVTSVDGIQLGVGWADCPFATDTDISVVV